MSDCRSCKLSDKVWGIIRPQAATLHRLTFSKTIADFLVNKFGNDYSVVRFEYRRGKYLHPDETSCNGLYAIIGTQKGLVLRISCSPESAAYMTQDEYRHIEEIYLKRL